MMFKISSEKIEDFIEKQHAIDGMVSMHDFELWLEEQPRVGEWIPCSERLPDNIKTVLVTIKELEEPILGWYGDKFGWRIVPPEFVNIKDYTVIAWLPLPEPYKENKE